MGKKKDFIWHSLRVSFILMVLFLLILLMMPFILKAVNLSPSFGSDLLYFFYFLVIFTLFASIINLKRYGKKAFLLISLIASSITILVFGSVILFRSLVH